MLQGIFILIFLTTKNLVVCKNISENIQCSEVFENNGLNYSTFPEGVAHGIHSLSLEEIRYFFKQDAPKNNMIPTVNRDLKAENVIHFNAPLWGYEDRFDTWALKIMDWFMRNDKKHLSVQVSSSLMQL